MARPKKNAVEQPLELNGDKLSTENNNTQQSQENAAQQESNGQVKESEEDKLPLEVIDGVPLPIYNSNNSFVIYAPNDIKAHKGQLLLKTGITLKNGYSGLMTPIIENALQGIPTETDYRLHHSGVISTYVKEGEEIRLVISINDETMIQEQTNFGSRTRNLIIPKGVPLATLIVYKL